MKVKIRIVPSLQVEMRVVNDDGSRVEGRTPVDTSGILAAFRRKEIQLLERGQLAPLSDGGGGPGFLYAAYELDSGAAAILKHLRGLRGRSDVIFHGPSRVDHDFTCPRCEGRAFGSREGPNGLLIGTCSDIACGFTWARSDDSVVMTHIVSGHREGT